jgi:beta-glucanase (GH16 family)
VQNPVVNAYAWHTYRMEMKDGVAKILVDGAVVNTVADGPWKDQNFHQILNVAAGGGLGGPFSFPGGAWAGMSVDYVMHQRWQ